MTDVTFDAIHDVPRPNTDQLPLGYEIEQRGWWVSDNTMRTLAQMSDIWFCGICGAECDGDSGEEACPYGLDYAEGCVISQRIREAVKQIDEGGEE